MMLLSLGVLIGLVLGLTGAGGSVFAVPLLMLLAGLPMTDAVGISLGAVTASTLYGSIRNAIQRGKKTSVLWKPGVVLASAGVITAPLGKWLGLHVHEWILISAFSALAVIIAARMWLGATKQPNTTTIVRAGNFTHTPSPDLLCSLSKTGQFELRPRCVSGLLAGGMLVGLLSGLFGVGGGFLIVPLLLTLSSVSMAQAVGTSLVIIALISGSGFVTHLWLSDVHNWSILTWVATGGVIGMIIGQTISHKIANALLQKIFAVCLLAIALITVSTKYMT